MSRSLAPADTMVARQALVEGFDVSHSVVSWPIQRLRSPGSAPDVLTNRPSGQRLTCARGADGGRLGTARAYMVRKPGSDRQADVARV
jgi:hypothetical protein